MTCATASGRPALTDVPIMWHVGSMVEGLQKHSRPAVLEDALTAISFKLELGDGVVRRLSESEMEATRAFVQLLDQCLRDLNRSAGMAEDRSALVRQSVLQGAFPVLVYSRRRLPRLAAEHLIRQWLQVTEAFGVLGAALSLADSVSEGQARPASIGSEGVDERQLLITFHTAVLEVLLASEARLRGREILRRLMAQLGLSFDQLGRMFRVSGETVRRWERGSHPIPDARLAKLAEADGALTRLTEIFRPDRLRQVLRREAELFDGESALDWILRGRISDAAARYETALSYQG